MRALNRKLLRDLWRLRGQVIAVAVVIGSGVAVLVMSLSTLEALQTTTDAYYERYRFGEIFASAKRTPERVAERIAAIPGVQFVQTRIAHFATLDIDGFSDPVIGRLTSVPDHGQPQLNQLALRQGRWVSPGRHDEAMISEPFAEAHNLGLGSTFTAIINGRKRTLTIVGIALSPEFIYALGPGSLLPDDKRFGVVWMGRTALEAAFDLENAFNDLSVSLLHRVDSEPVIAAIDLLLAPYGGISAVGRTDQLSNWFVMNELEQIRTMSTLLPGIFLSVAAFLSYTVLSRLIAIERAEIGLLKAFGYRHIEIAWHYAKFVIAIAVVGSAIGFVFGALFGRYNTENYAELFRFPLLIYRPSAMAFLIAGTISLCVTFIGALGAVRKAATLPPAEAMRPPAPAVYRRTRFSATVLGSWCDQPTRIALRQIGRWPLRAALTCTGIAFAVGLLIMALQWNDSIDYTAEKFFFEAQRQTLSVGFSDPQPLRVVREFEHLPGVLKAEPWRAVSADFSVGTVVHRGSIRGVDHTSILQPIHDDAANRDIAVPQGGLVLGTYLAKKLGVAVGDSVFVEVLEGRRPAAAVPVVQLFETTIGMPAVMHIDALNAWLRVRPEAEFLSLLVDRNDEARLFAKLKELPAISAVTHRRAALDAFYDTLAEQILVYIIIFTGFACALGFGVTYNSVRIALSERGRELATLRVLGFTRGEISYILLAEVSILIFAALPLGCLVGRGLTLMIARAFDTELFRMPFVIGDSTYGLGVVCALAATAASAGLVRTRVAHLDLIRVLKTRE